MAWRRLGDKPLSVATLVSLLASLGLNELIVRKHKRTLMYDFVYDVLVDKFGTTYVCMYDANDKIRKRKLYRKLLDE